MANILTAVTEGILFGLVLAVMIGPVFFALIQTSISKGFKAGCQMVVGIALSDLFCILLAYYGLSGITQTAGFQYYAGLIGGGIMSIIGLVGLFKQQKSQPAQIDAELKKAKGWMLASRAFVLNLLNPFVFVFWLTTTTGVMSRFEAPLAHLAFFTGMVVTAVGTDVAKAYAAKLLKPAITERRLRIINLIVSVALIAFGLRTVFKSLAFN